MRVHNSSGIKCFSVFHKRLTLTNGCQSSHLVHDTLVIRHLETQQSDGTFNYPLTRNPSSHCQSIHSPGRRGAITPTIGDQPYHSISWRVRRPNCTYSTGSTSQALIPGQPTFSAANIAQRFWHVT